MKRERLDNLEIYTILYTRSEPIFDQLAAMTATMLSMPVAMINFADVRSEISLSSLAILKDQTTAYKGINLEPSLLSNPHIAAEHGFRFYAASPIINSEGFNTGVICVADSTTRTFTAEDQEILDHMAKLVQIEILNRAP